VCYHRLTRVHIRSTYSSHLWTDTCAWFSNLQRHHLSSLLKIQKKTKRYSSGARCLIQWFRIESKDAALGAREICFVKGHLIVGDRASQLVLPDCTCTWLLRSCWLPRVWLANAFLPNRSTWPTSRSSSASIIAPIPKTPSVDATWVHVATSMWWVCQRREWPARAHASGLR